MRDDGYTKLLSRIIRSTIWQESHATFKVWITLLALVDSHGFVSGSIVGLAHTANVTLAEAQEAILKFSSPDTHSTTKDNEGRRVREEDGGWIVLNYLKIRSEKAAESKREYQRDWVNKKRSSISQKSTLIDKSTMSRQTETETETETDKREKSPPVRPSVEDFLKTLKENPAYKHINLEVELGKMRAWLALPKNTARKLTRQFILNWINKIENPLECGAPPPKTRSAWHHSYQEDSDE